VYVFVALWDAHVRLGIALTGQDAWVGKVDNVTGMDLAIRSGFCGAATRKSHGVHREYSFSIEPRATLLVAA
jgi:hypothetical protein